jgi:hypothetical protein
MSRIQQVWGRGDMAIRCHRGLLSLITGLGLIALCHATHDSLSRLSTFLIFRQRLVVRRDGLKTWFGR